MSGGFCSFSASARPDIFLNNRIRISNYRDCILVTAAILFVFFVFFVILTFFAAYAGNTSLAVSAVVTIISILGILFLLLDFTAGIYQIIAAVLIAVPLYNLQLFITVSLLQLALEINISVINAIEALSPILTGLAEVKGELFSIQFNRSLSGLHCSVLGSAEVVDSPRLIRLRHIVLALDFFPGLNLGIIYTHLVKAFQHLAVLIKCIVLAFDSFNLALYNFSVLICVEPALFSVSVSLRILILTWNRLKPSCAQPAVRRLGVKLIAGGCRIARC